MKKIRYIFLLSILFTLGMCTHSYAKITTNNPTVESGKTVTITINSQEPVASGAITLKKNNGLTFNSVSGGTANGTLVAFSKSNNTTSGIATYTFTAPTVTESKVFELVFSSQDMADENGNTVNPSTATATVTVKGTGNGNNNSGGNTNKPEEPKKGVLSTCYINGIKVNEYLTVKNKESVPVAINTSTKEGATIYNSNTKETYNVRSGNTTNIKLAEGTNTLTITLESGNKYTRKIYSQKEEAEVKPNIIEEPEEKFLLKSLVIKGKDENNEEVKFTLTPNFFKEAFEYLITIPEEQSYITSLDVEAVGQKSEYIIEITGNEELVAGENVITILVKSKDGSKSTTYTVKVNKLGEPEETEPTVAAPVETTKKENNNNENKMVNTIKTFIVVFTLVVLLAGIIFAIIEYEYGKTTQANKKVKKEKKQEEIRRRR